MKQHELSRKAPDVASGRASDPDACPPIGDGESGGRLVEGIRQGLESRALTPQRQARNNAAAGKKALMARLSGFLIRRPEADNSRNSALRSAIAPEGCP